jgi:cell division protein DivIC
MKRAFSYIPSILKNKYLLTIVTFMVWMLFFDRNDLISQFGRFQKLSELQQSSAYYDQKIADAKAELERRKNDPTAYERLAREKYYMKKDNEDLFIFEE